MGSRTGIVGICLVLATAMAGPAQDPRQSWQVSILEPGPGSGLELLPRARPDGLISQVSWTPAGSEEEIEITLANRVQDCAAAVTADGNGLVILAGGIRDSLDVYLIDRRAPDLRPYATLGGRRLSRSFNDGLGSWPLVEGPHLALFAYVKQLRVEFVAMDFQGRIHKSRKEGLPFDEVRGFTAESDLETNEMRIRFDSIGEVLEFDHPLAPRMDLGHGGELDFGSPPVGREVFRAAEVRNTGQRDLHVKASASGPGFRIAGPTDLVVEPDEVGLVHVGFTADSGGSFDGQLVLRPNLPDSRQVALRGEGLVPVDPDPEAKTDPARAAAASEVVPAREESIGETSAEASLVSDPQFRFVKIDQSSPDRVSVTGLLLAPQAGGANAIELQAGGDPVRATLGPAGEFLLEDAPAIPGEWVWLSAVGRGNVVSPPVVVGQVLPAVYRVSDRLLIRTRPSSRFLLAAVAMDAGEQRVQRLWAAWEGRTDEEGVASVDLDRFGPLRVPLHVLVYAADRGTMRPSNLLRLEPDGGPPR